jgi:macrolide transport system ATP-binding/permease protein
MTNKNRPLIELLNIGKYYGYDTDNIKTNQKHKENTNQQPKVTVLKNISLKINAGEFVAIIGTSGSGKSTLMNILGCLDRPTSGQYLFSGADVANFTSDKLAWLRREAFGFIFQSYHLIPSESATENVEVPALYAGLPDNERRERSQLLLRRLGLGERLDNKPNQLSGGQQQRVSIARALMNGGNIILADEPTGALDTATSIEVMTLLKELANAGHTIILITHDQKVAEQAHRIIDINDGEIIKDYVPEQHKNDVHNDNISQNKRIQQNHTSLTSDFSLDHHHKEKSKSSLIANLEDAALAATRVMLSNPFRTILTLLGIIIGVASVIIMLSLIQGSQQKIKDEMGAFGNSIMYLNGTAPTPLDPVGDITLYDIKMLSTLPEINFISPSIGEDKLLRYGNKNIESYTRGTAITFPQLNNWPVEKGRFFSELEYNRSAAVAIIGYSIQKKLFDEKEDPIGKFILVDQNVFQIIGILKKRGSKSYEDRNNQIIMPYTTALTRIYGPTHPEYITVAANDDYPFKHTEKVINNMMLDLHHGINNFEIHNDAAEIEAKSAISGQMTLLLGAIASISLLVGGIGVMNVMLMTVRERTREIGIRIATGARQIDILRQFLTESTLLSIVGGIIGIILSLALLKLTVFISDDIPIAISPTVIVAAFGCAVITGIIFGYTPARKAAQLDPVTALANE